MHIFQIDPSKLLMTVPGDVAGLINGDIQEISRDGTVRFWPFVKDDDEATTPTKRRRTSSVSLADDPILGFTVIMKYGGKKPHPVPEGNSVEGESPQPQLVTGDLGKMCSIM